MVLVVSPVESARVGHQSLDSALLPRVGHQSPDSALLPRVGHQSLGSALLPRVGQQSLDSALSSRVSASRAWTVLFGVFIHILFIFRSAHCRSLTYLGIRTCFRGHPYLIQFLTTAIQIVVLYYAVIPSQNTVFALIWSYTHKRTHIILYDFQAQAHIFLCQPIFPYNLRCYRASN